MKTIKIPFDFKIAEQAKNTENGLITFETRCGYALDILSIDIINDSYKIAALAKDKDGKQFVMLYNDKAEPTNKDSSMDILMNVPYYYSFKEGDVIAYNNGVQNVMSIFKKNVDLYTYERYAILTESEGLEINSDVNMMYKDSRKANEEEISFFISKLKEDGSEKAIELIRKFFPNIAIFNFSTFDKVLVKNFINDKWEPNFFANILIEENNKIRYKCIGGNVYNYCIPYSNSLKTEDENFKINNFEYVDFGLPSGTKWAKCNVGADNEEDPGLYFQYGGIHGVYRNEIGIDGKKSFSSDKSDYDFWNDGDTEKLSRPFLSLEDDAAHVHMGGKWRMPTKEDMIELLTYTDVYMVKSDGTEVKGEIGNDSTIIESISLFKFNGVDRYTKIKGFKFYKKDDDRYIFIPSSGVALNNYICSPNSGTYIWLANKCFYLHMTTTTNGIISIDLDGFYGMSIRGVFK